MVGTLRKIARSLGVDVARYPPAQGGAARWWFLAQRDQLRTVFQLLAQGGPGIAAFQHHAVTDAFAIAQAWQGQYRPVAVLAPATGKQ